jgi:hypothetical protein
VHVVLASADSLGELCWKKTRSMIVIVGRRKDGGRLTTHCVALSNITVCGHKGNGVRHLPVGKSACL